MIHFVQGRIQDEAKEAIASFKNWKTLGWKNIEVRQLDSSKSTLCKIQLLVPKFSLYK